MQPNALPVHAHGYIACPWEVWGECVECVVCAIGEAVALPVHVLIRMQAKVERQMQAKRLVALPVHGRRPSEADTGQSGRLHCLSMCGRLHAKVEKQMQAKRPVALPVY